MWKHGLCMAVAIAAIIMATIMAAADIIMAVITATTGINA